MNSYAAFEISGFCASGTRHMKSHTDNHIWLAQLSDRQPINLPSQSIQVQQNPVNDNGTLQSIVLHFV